MITRSGNDFLVEKVSIREIASQVGTPFYVYSKKLLIENIETFRKPFREDIDIFYAVKANSNLSLLREIFAQGLGADVVSIGELQRCLKAGLNPNKIIFSGVGKTKAELEDAASYDIFAINIESPHEIAILKNLNKHIRVSLRINPNISAKTHPKIATGLHSTKFGLTPAQAIKMVAEIKHSKISLVGISCHIGSQILDVSSFKDAAQFMVKFAEDIAKRGVHLEFIDMGGGVGIRYKNEKPFNPQKYAQMLEKEICKRGFKLVLEPGRRIIGNTGALIADVITTKQSPKKNFAIISAGMNDLMRPSLYDAYHDVISLTADKRKKIKYDVVGPVCETADILARDRMLPELTTGDLVAINHTGAYGFSMSSHYNTRPRVTEVLVDGKNWAIIRKRETMLSLWAEEIF